MTVLRKALLRPLVALLFCALLPWAGAAEQEVSLNFVGADIESVVKAVGQITGRNFILDPRVKGTINVVSGKPIAPSLVYQVMVSALRMQGFAVVEGKGATKILPEAESRVQGSPVVGKGQRRTVGGDEIATQIFQLRYESAPQMVNVLKPLVSANQSITANSGSNTIVVTDTGENLARLERIIESIDVPHGDDPQIIQLKYASAAEVATNLNKMFAPSANSPNSLVVTADIRGNRIIVRADSPGLLTRAATLVASMDKPESGLGNIRVVYLKHADATKMAQTLRAILGTETGASGSSTSTSSLSPTSSAMTGSTPSALGGASSAITPTALLPSTSSQSGSGALLPGSLIQADVGNNALIITATETVFNNLQNVIAMLDRRRVQVHLEALVVELTAEHAAQFGIQWQDLSGLTKNSVQAIGGTNFGGTGTNILTASANLGSLGRGLNFGIANGQISVPGLGTITNLGLLAQFLETEAKANVLSTPSIMTLDNEEARIIIGQNLPFVTGSYSTTGGGNTTVTPFQTYERRDVGLTLKVRPQVTEGGVVRVQIYQEASSVQATSTTSASGPITNKRALESNVLVDDGGIIVLGGLIEDSYGNDEEKVPVLGDVPVLGNLFRYESRKRKKTNLMLFLRPRIIRDGMDYRGVTEDRYQQLMIDQKRQVEQGVPVWGKQAQPQLPGLEQVGKGSLGQSPEQSGR